MINLTSPTRTNYAITLDQGTVTSGSVAFTSKKVSVAPFNAESLSVSVLPQNGVIELLEVVSKDGVKVSLVQSTSVDGAIESHPKESN